MAQTTFIITWAHVVSSQLVSRWNVGVGLAAVGRMLVVVVRGREGGVAASTTLVMVVSE